MIAAWLMGWWDRTCEPPAPPVWRPINPFVAWGQEFPLMVSYGAGYRTKMTTELEEVWRTWLAPL